MSAPGQDPKPRPTLSLREAIAIIVGIVVGAGVFKAPALVAQFTGSPGWMFAAWVAGGVVSLAGALCYAELAAAWPNAGGDYHFLLRAYGRRVAFLFAWARFSVITTGSIALLAFVFGDYASQLLRLGPHSESVWAAAVVIALTWINLRGIRWGARTQSWLTLAEVGGLVLVGVAGAWLLARGAAIPASPPAGSAQASGFPPAFGLAMVFVLLTFGGWNEAAYLGAELRDVRRNMLRALVASIAAVSGLYLLVNWAYLQGLGMQGMAASKAVAADLLQAAFGPAGATLVSAMVAVAALTSINATMIVGARTNYAVGRDWPALAALGRWNGVSGVPVNALLAQSGFALALVLFGGGARGGFEAMVDYTAPVFWSFFLLSTLALLVLRVREPGTPRPFRVPLYPLLPLAFAAVCAWMLWSSLAHVRAGALAGVGVLLAGGLLLAMVERRSRALRRAAGTPSPGPSR